MIWHTQKAYFEHDEDRILFRFAGGKDHKLTINLFSRVDGKVPLVTAPDVTAPCDCPRDSCAHPHPAARQDHH